MIGSVNHCIYFYNKTLTKKNSNNNKTHVVTDSPATPSTYTWSQSQITYHPHLLTPLFRGLVLRLQALHWSCHLPAGFLTHSGRPPPVFTTKRGKITTRKSSVYWASSNSLVVARTFWYCSSSSPLLSLVTSTSEISHQPVHTYTTYIYDKGVDRTGRQGIEENYSITRGRWGEKK